MIPLGRQPNQTTRGNDPEGDISVADKPLCPVTERRKELGLVWLIQFER